MENATKALLIAAAILIAIVLISIGVYVLSIGQQSVQNADMSEQEVATFNAKFESYAGTNVMGSKVKALISTIENNNRVEGDNGKKVTCDKTSADINTGKAYSVSFTKDTNSGLINAVTITAK